MESAPDTFSKAKLRTWKPTIAGIISIAVGVINTALALIIGVLFAVDPDTLIDALDEAALLFLFMRPFAIPLITGISIPAIVSLVGGIYALKRRAYPLALAGALCLLLSPGIILGIPTIILLILSGEEFH